MPPPSTRRWSTWTSPLPKANSSILARRLAILAGASLIAPTVIVIQAIRGEQVDVPVLAVCSAVLFVLVLVRLNGLMVDIGEYRRTERQMREAEAKYRSLVEGLPAVVYIAEFGKDAAWTYISPKVESILGFTPDEWTGRPTCGANGSCPRTVSSPWTRSSGC